MSSTFLSEQSGQNYDFYCRNFSGSGAINVADNISTNGDISAGNFSLSNNAGTFISNTGGFIGNQLTITNTAISGPVTLTPQQCNSKDYYVTSLGAGTTNITLPSLASFLATYPYLSVGHTMSFSVQLAQNSSANTGNNNYLIVIPGANGSAPSGNPGPGTSGLYMIASGVLVITGTGVIAPYIMSHNFKIIFTGAALGGVPTGYYVI